MSVDRQKLKSALKFNITQKKLMKTKIIKKLK